jgi:hypothetical protein
MVVEATALQRAQAHNRLLRKVKIEIERLREQEKVKTPRKRTKQSMLTYSNIAGCDRRKETGQTIQEAPWTVT